MTALPGHRQPEQATTPLQFVLGTTSLGAVLAAVTDQGVCAVLLGLTHHELCADLHRRFPRASHTEQCAPLGPVLREVIHKIEYPASACTLPLDLQGTPFQVRVWQELQTVPPGATIAYTDLASRLGSSTSIRAVRGAVAANHLAVLVPCHRVVRRDGQLCGYRWGLERKRALLDREAAAAPFALTPP